MIHGDSPLKLQDLSLIRAPNQVSSEDMCRQEVIYLETTLAVYGVNGSEWVYKISRNNKEMILSKTL